MKRVKYKKILVIAMSIMVLFSTATNLKMEEELHPDEIIQENSNDNSLIESTPNEEVENTMPPSESISPEDKSEETDTSEFEEIIDTETSNKSEELNEMNNSFAVQNDLVSQNNVSTLSAPGDDKNTIITISEPDHLKGCYYRDSSGNPTDNWTDEQCFKDETLRKYVYDALIEFYTEENSNFSNNNSVNVGFNFAVTDTTLTTTTNTNMRAILAGFRGDIEAKWKTGTDKIKSIQGIQFLIHANEIDLRNNGIRDFTEINKTVNYDNNHYGYKPGDDPEDSTSARNVTWNVGGNPIEKLPYGFGGRLVIKQPATTSYSYPNDEQEVKRFYREDIEIFNTEINIKKCEIMKTKTDSTGNTVLDTDSTGNVVYRPVRISSINFVKMPPDDNGHIGGVIDSEDINSGLHLDKSQGDFVDPNDTAKGYKGYTDEKLYLKGIQTSRRQKIGIGADQEVHYQTVDEYDTRTPGSQSFKYYLDPYFYIYDYVDIKEYKSVELTKVDSTTNNPLKGAQYTLYDSIDQIVSSNLETDENGKLLLNYLSDGTYTLKETKAPVGYQIDNNDLKILVSGSNIIQLAGGSDSFTAYDKDNKEVTKISTTTTRYIAGALDNDLEIKSTGQGEVQEVKVSYKRVRLSDVSVDDVKEGHIETFKTIKDAQDSINDKKKKGWIYGSVSIDVSVKSTDTAANIKHSNVKTPTPTPPGPTPNTPTDPPRPTEPTEKYVVPNTSDITKTITYTGLIGSIVFGVTAVIFLNRKYSR